MEKLPDDSSRRPVPLDYDRSKPMGTIDWFAVVFMLVLTLALAGFALFVFAVIFMSL